MNKNYKIDLLTLLSALYLLHSVPIVGYYMPASAFLALIALLYLVMILKSGLRGFMERLVLSFPIMALYLLRIIVVYIHGDHAIIYDLYSFLQMLVFPLLGLHVLRTKDKAFSRTLMVVIIVSYAITAVTTIMGCRTFPNAARALTGSQDDLMLYGQYKRMNIGDFHFIYFITLTLPLLIGAIRLKNLSKVLGYLMIGLVIVCVYYSAYTTAILLAIAVLPLFFIPRRVTVRKAAMLGAVAIIVLFAGRIAFSDYLSNISGLIRNEEVSGRIEDMSLMFSGESVDSFDDDSDLGARFRLFSRSLDSFAKNPVFGSWQQKSIGGHSYFFDTLGLFGLLGLLLYIWMYRSAYRLFIYPFRNKPWYVYIIVSFFFVIVQSILNPHPSTQVFSFMYPLFAVLMDKSKYSK